MLQIINITRVCPLRSRTRTHQGNYAMPLQLATFFAELDIPSECLIEFVHMGGDIMAYESGETAFAARTAQYSFYTYGRFSGNHDASKRDEVIKFATSTYNSVRESGCAVGSYINYTDRLLESHSCMKRKSQLSILQFYNSYSCCLCSGSIPCFVPLKSLNGISVHENPKSTPTVTSSSDKQHTIKAGKIHHHGF